MVGSPAAHAFLLVFLSGFWTLCVCVCNVFLMLSDHKMAKIEGTRRGTQSSCLLVGGAPDSKDPSNDCGCRVSERAAIWQLRVSKSCAVILFFFPFDI